MEDKYLVVKKDILPDVFDRVIQVKKLLEIGEVKEITEAVKRVGISRSTYYKYKDSVYKISDTNKGRKATLIFLLNHKLGVLSNLLEIISENRGNILTINQDIPINNIAHVSITFDISNICMNIENILRQFKDVDGVLSVKLIAME